MFLDLFTYTYLRPLARLLISRYLPITAITHHGSQYDVVQYFHDHGEAYPSLSKIFIGTLAPHITTEVDCESLFSQAGHAAHQNYIRTVAETFERQVIQTLHIPYILLSSEGLK
jgi:hypothetical protein